ncbi:hypothetical protein [Microbacterium sp.]|uniref:hypothetical protein n=1 Tax=Microbacterium sp. TaxID=51671 RepID=UPI003A8A6F74
MAMDIYGKNATAEVGRYFRNTVWWWRPLASFLTAAYPELTAGCTHWQSNDGDGLDENGALALADALDRDLANGRVTAHADQYATEIAALPDSDCDLCQGTGLRTDGIGRSRGMDKPRDRDTGKGGCNGCQGTGRRRHWDKNYSFDVENVREFAAFLRHSGGFEIC